jgi:hypothetical protein
MIVDEDMGPTELGNISKVAGTAATMWKKFSPDVQKV